MRVRSRSEKRDISASNISLKKSLSLGSTDAESLCIKEIYQWAVSTFPDAAASVMDLLTPSLKWQDVLSLPGKGQLEMLSLGEKRELVRSMQHYIDGDRDSMPMFNHVFLAKIQRATDTIRQVYALDKIEMGYNTNGHTGLTAEDHREALANHSSLLYGELLPSAVSKMLDDSRLCARDSTVLFDLGMGLGKACMQAFLTYPNLKRVVGVELAPSRAGQALQACHRLAKLIEKGADAAAPSTSSWRAACARRRSPGSSTQAAHSRAFVDFQQDSKQASLILPDSERSLELRQQNLFETEPWDADIIILETELPCALHGQLATFLQEVKVGARLLSYENLDAIYEGVGSENPFSRLAVNTAEDRYFTTWAHRYGHRFHLWMKTQ